MSPRRERSACAASAPATERPLQAAQAWLYAAITGADVPPDSDDVLVAGHVGVGTRLGIYRHAYRARLEECLADDYPAVRALIGEGRFARRCAIAITQHPPREPTLNRYGRFMPGFLQEQRGVPAAAADLARLEWALVEAIHSPCGEIVDVDALARVQPAQLASARFHADPSLRVVVSRFDVDASLATFQRTGTCPAPARLPSAVAVQRRPSGLRRTPLAAGFAPLLAALAAGQPLSAAISTIPPRLLTQDALAGCFRRWFAAGFLVGVQS